MSQHTEDILQFFEHAHLPPHLQAVSKPFCDLAHEIVRTLPRNPERTVALRKLVESKDCAVRAVLFKAAAPEVVKGPQRYTVPATAVLDDVHEARKFSDWCLRFADPVGADAGVVTLHPHAAVWPATVHWGAAEPLEVNPGDDVMFDPQTGFSKVSSEAAP